MAQYERELESLEKKAAALAISADDAAGDAFSRCVQFAKMIMAIENIFETCSSARPKIQHGRSTKEKWR